MLLTLRIATAPGADARAVVIAWRRASCQRNWRQQRRRHGTRVRHQPRGDSARRGRAVHGCDQWRAERQPGDQIGLRRLGQVFRAWRGRRRPRLRWHRQQDLHRRFHRRHQSRQVGRPKDLLLGLYDGESTGTGVTGVTLSVTGNGSSLFNASYSSATSAVAAFDDQSHDLAALTTTGTSCPGATPKRWACTWPRSPHV